MKHEKKKNKIKRKEKKKKKRKEMRRIIKKKKGKLSYLVLPSRAAYRDSRRSVVPTLRAPFGGRIPVVWARRIPFRLSGIQELLNYGMIILELSTFFCKSCVSCTY